MYRFQTQHKLMSYLNDQRRGRSLGFVPTMGAIHKGHLKLIQEAKRECEMIICSIFINPMQFNSTEDFANYPNTLNEDLEKLEQLDCDIVYTPAINDLYTENEEAKQFNFGSLGNYMEGKFRPGHFNGMATIVEKLFNIILPTKAFFGQKDLQQLQIVKELTKQMNSTIKIVSVATARENNGLAKSSRNQLLSKKAKDQAGIIYECLNYCKRNKNRDVVYLKSYIQNIFKQQKFCQLEYAEIVSLNTMLPIQKWEGKNDNAICIAAHIEGVRLIDNIIL